MCNGAGSRHLGTGLGGVRILMGDRNEIDANGMGVEMYYILLSSGYFLSLRSKRNVQRSSAGMSIWG